MKSAQRPRVLTALREQGPCVRHDLEVPGMCDRQLDRHLRRLRAEGLVVICGWDLSLLYGKRYPRPVWAVARSGRKDVPRPPRATQAEAQRRYRARKRALAATGDVHL